MQFPKNDAAVAFFRANNYGVTYNDGMYNWLGDWGYTGSLVDRIHQAEADGFTFALEVPGP